MQASAPKERPPRGAAVVGAGGAVMGLQLETDDDPAEVRAPLWPEAARRGGRRGPWARSEAPATPPRWSGAGALEDSQFQEDHLQDFLERLMTDKELDKGPAASLLEVESNRSLKSRWPGFMKKIPLVGGLLKTTTTTTTTTLFAGQVIRAYTGPGLPCAVETDTTRVRFEPVKIEERVPLSDRVLGTGWSADLQEGWLYRGPDYMPVDTGITVTALEDSTVYVFAREDRARRKGEPMQFSCGYPGALGRGWQRGGGAPQMMVLPTMAPMKVWGVTTTPTVTTTPDPFNRAKSGAGNKAMCGSLHKSPMPPPFGRDEVKESHGIVESTGDLQACKDLCMAEPTCHYFVHMSNRVCKTFTQCTATFNQEQATTEIYKKMTAASSKVGTDLSPEDAEAEARAAADAAAEDVPKEVVGRRFPFMMWSKKLKAGELVSWQVRKPFQITRCVMGIVVKKQKDALAVLGEALGAVGDVLGGAGKAGAGAAGGAMGAEGGGAVGGAEPNWGAMTAVAALSGLLGRRER